MRSNSFAKKSRAASHLAGDECSPGCGHMGLQLLDPPEKPESWDVRGDITLLTFRPNFPWQKKFPLKIKSSDMQNQIIIIIIIMRWFPQIITYSKIRRTVLAHKICSLQVFQSSVFFQETAVFLWIVAAGFLQR